MNDKSTLLSQIKTAGYRLNLMLGEFVLDPIPLGEGESSVVFKAKLDDKIVALKFSLFETDNAAAELAKFRKDYLAVSLLEIRRNIVQYADYDIVHFPNMDVSVLVMKLYKCSLCEYRKILSVEGFLKLFHFLINTLQFLHGMNIRHGAITPNNILVDDHNEFVLTDVAIGHSTGSVESDIMSIGKLLSWYAFGEPKSEVSISKVFPTLGLYDQVVARCINSNNNTAFHSVQEIQAFVEAQQERDPEELIRAFNMICRKNFPRELPEFVHCADQRKITKLFADFSIKKDFFGSNAIYFTDVKRDVFSPKLYSDGYIKMDKYTELKVLDIWVHCDDEMLNDYILVHHANTMPKKVNGKDVYKWAVYEDKTTITWEEAMNGYADSDGETMPLDKTKLEFYNRLSREGYFFIALNHFHSLTNPGNMVTLRDSFFRFSFSYVNRYMLEEMNNQIKHHQSLFRSNHPNIVL